MPIHRPKPQRSPSGPGGALGGAGAEDSRSGAELPTEVTLEGLAQRWGMSSKTLRNWRTQGRGPVGTRRGKIVVFAREDVLQWEAQQKREARAELEAKLLSDDYKITVRPHPKYPTTRLQADLLLPLPYRRARLAVPQGMTEEKDILLWARREGKRIMRDQKLDLDPPVSG